MGQQEKPQIEIDFTNIDNKVIAKNTQIIHKDDFIKVVDLIMDDVGNENGTFIESFSDEDRIHNAIFINGSRGSGKTQFLLFLRECDNYCLEKNVLEEISIFGPIDPTLLHDNESFLTIVLAKILNDIDKNLKDLREKEKRDFYELLKNISIAIDGVVHNKNSNRTTLENIAQDQSSLKLEVYLHIFFQTVCKLIGRRRLVFLIDDIDMAFDKGFEILEVIRKYLSSPNIVPVITGDLWLYEDILEKHFFKKLENKYLISKYYEHTYKNAQHHARDTIEETQKDYLTKVLPSHRRMKLKTIFDLARDHIIVFKYKKNHDLIKYTFTHDGESAFYETPNYGEGVFYEIVHSFMYSPETKYKFLKALFSNNLRTILQCLHGEVNNQMFGFDSWEGVRDNKTKYSLNNILVKEPFEDSLHRGIEEFNRGSFQAAIRYLKISLQIKETEVGYTYLGHSYFSVVDYSNAIFAYKKVVTTNPDEYLIHYRIGYSYFRLGKPRVAIDSYEIVLKYIPNNYKTHNALGLCHSALGHYNEAFRYYKDSISFAEDDYYKAYLNIFELALIYSRFLERNSNEIERYRQIFLEQFSDNEVALKVYRMIKIMSSITVDKVKDIEDQFIEWLEEYQGFSFTEWSFKPLEKWANSQEDKALKEILLEYIEKFKQNM